MNIYDVSERAGVSIATVSRVLNGNPNVSERTRKKVLAVTNLKPRKMLGHESQGMLLSSEADGDVKLALVGDEHPVGAELG